WHRRPAATLIADRADVDPLHAIERRVAGRDRLARARRARGADADLHAGTDRRARTRRVCTDRRARSDRRRGLLRVFLLLRLFRFLGLFGLARVVDLALLLGLLRLRRLQRGLEPGDARLDLGALV